jgi:hypothetical protein
MLVAALPRALVPAMDAPVSNRIHAAMTAAKKCAAQHGLVGGEWLPSSRRDPHIFALAHPPRSRFRPRQTRSSPASSFYPSPTAPPPHPASWPRPHTAPRNAGNVLHPRGSRQQRPGSKPPLNGDQLRCGTSPQLQRTPLQVGCCWWAVRHPDCRAAGPAALAVGGLLLPRRRRLTPPLMHTTLSLPSNSHQN